MSSETNSCTTTFAWKVGPYVDGELPLEERDSVEAHLSGCADCRDLARTFRNLDSLVAGARPPAVSGREWSRILDRVEREPRIVEAPARRRGWEWLVPIGALAALLVIGVSLGVRLLDHDPVVAPASADPGTPVEAVLPGDPDVDALPIRELPGDPRDKRNPRDVHEPRLDGERLDTRRAPVDDDGF